MSDPWEESLFVDRAASDPDAPVSEFVMMQRVVVRMLFDPGFARAVYEDSDRALDGLPLGRALVTQLLSNDRRLWNADEMRRSRALKVLLDEFRVSTTLVLWERRRIAFLDGFFGSPEFHDAVTWRGYMALAFCAFLERHLEEGALTSDALRAALALEAGMARSRRELRDARRGRDPYLRRQLGAAPGEKLVVAPGVRALEVPGGTLELIQHIEKYLFELALVPALALCEDAPSPEPLPALDGSRPETYLLEPQKGGKVDLNGIPPTFARIVAGSARPISLAELAADLERAGVRDEDLADYLEQLVEAGVLRRVRVASDGEVEPLD